MHHIFLMCANQYRQGRPRFKVACTNEPEYTLYLIIDQRYSLVRLVLPNTEMLISLSFTGLYKIRLLLRDRMRPKEQILVNKSDKYDHPHQREPWCFVEVVNKVGAEVMPKLI